MTASLGISTNQQPVNIACLQALFFRHESYCYYWLARWENHERDPRPAPGHFRLCYFQIYRLFHFKLIGLGMCPRTAGWERGIPVIRLAVTGGPCFRSADLSPVETALRGECGVNLDWRLSSQVFSYCLRRSPPACRVLTGQMFFFKETCVWASIFVF